MLVLSTSRPYLRVPIYGPPGWDPATVTAELALIADTGAEPAETDWHAAFWAGTVAVLLIGPGGGVVYPAGNYMCFARLTAGSERPVLDSSRVRIGFP